MTVSADSRDSNATEDAGSPANPDTTRQADKATDQQAGKGAAASPERQKPGGEEPDMALESDLPSDGRDPVGEAMIRDLPQRPELSEPPSQPHPSNQAK